MIKYFEQQEQWKKFIDAVKRKKILDSIVADEAIWPFIISGYTGMKKETVLF